MNTKPKRHHAFKTPHAALASALRRAREAKALTQDQLIDGLLDSAGQAITLSAYGRIERVEQAIPLELICTLEERLSVRPRGRLLAEAGLIDQVPAVGLHDAIEADADLFDDQKRMLLTMEAQFRGDAALRRETRRAP